MPIDVKPGESRVALAVERQDSFVLSVIESVHDPANVSVQFNKAGK